MEGAYRLPLYNEVFRAMVLLTTRSSCPSNIPTGLVGVSIPYENGLQVRTAYILPLLHTEGQQRCAAKTR